MAQAMQCLLRFECFGQCDDTSKSLTY